jgi:hypothetical protein
VTTNLYRQLLELLPQSPLTVGTVVSQHGDNTATVQYPGGAQSRVRGSGHTPGGRVFVRDGVIEGAAPALSAVTIDV